MSTADAWENGQLNLVFNNTAFTGLGDAGGLLPSAAAGNIYVSLHTADPGESGNQSTNETGYGGYTRQGKTRAGTEFTVVAGVATNVSDIVFPIVASGGPVTFTHVGIGTAVSGTGKLMYSGALTTPKTAQNGDAPKILAGSLTITIT